MKPWFNGRLEFSPPVENFSQSGYPLIGGRLYYVAGRSVAVLAYGRHMISVMLWPAGTGSNAGPAVHTSQGYHLLHWTDPSFTYWVVSDLGMSELEEFVSLVRRSH